MGTASANLDEASKDDESQEVAQQREQFKEIAKNKSVANALRFCNNVGPFSVGRVVDFSKKPEVEEEVTEVIEIKSDSENDKKEDGVDKKEQEEKEEKEEKEKVLKEE